MHGGHDSEISRFRTILVFGTREDCEKMVEEIIEGKLQEVAETLTPELITAYRDGKLADFSMVALYKHFPSSRLHTAIRQVLNLQSLCLELELRMMDCGVTELQDTLMKWLYHNHHSSEGLYRVDVVESLSKWGDGRALELLRAIVHELAPIVPEKKAKLIRSYASGTMTLEEPFVLMADEHFLGTLRRAITKMQERLSDDADQ